MSIDVLYVLFWSIDLHLHSCRRLYDCIVTRECGESSMELLHLSAVNCARNCRLLRFGHAVINESLLAFRFSITMVVKAFLSKVWSASDVDSPSDRREACPRQYKRCSCLVYKLSHAATRMGWLSGDSLGLWLEHFLPTFSLLNASRKPLPVLPASLGPCRPHLIDTTNLTTSFPPRSRSPSRCPTTSTSPGSLLSCAT